ncbi:DUF1090 domain-containing protein [Pseudomonas sp. GD03842]|uniref:DUF1090 domain-containing protein n=1 Tax=unclassified Pseudomonas TaxID=196821 RepID=UPI000D3CBC11|nr:MULTISPECIES: DUF1090 domain-containing protein [unclassified Pseudomonas]MDH0747330.1 DUF1090 domain-containing protein [Pseudomonas sp. GD03842]RAU46175.1 DUF1090 domain-containing protein [Pseudomonas sp. RIT 409]RAU53779.1 DUF1090 domain-containing protein [Pseudomonas sp. RIT 412]
MKVFSSLMVFAACGMLAAPSFAAEPLCEAKRGEIQAGIEQAKAAGNSEQQAGLEKALAENTDHCTDAGLIKAQEKKVLEAKQEVGKRQTDLDKAMKKGDADKINKRKDKLAESRKALQDEQQKLEEIQPDEDDE